MRRRELLTDLLVGVVALVISVAVLQTDPAPGEDLRSVDGWAYVILAAYSASVVLRRMAPGLAALGGVSAGVVYAAAQYPPALTPVALLSVYSAAVILPQRAARAVLAGTLALGAIGSTLGPGPTDLGVPAFILSSWLFGNYVRSRRAYTAELEAKNRLLEQAQRDLADRAVAEERLRIARELHDVVAHTMSVVALHAGTGRMIASDDPAAARPVLATIETATRSSLVELRRMLGVLRETDGEPTHGLSPAPGLVDLDALVAEVVEAGVRVEVRVEGTRTTLPMGVDVSAYRIVQEALTNVIKHAGGARTTVVVRYDADAVTLAVDNDGLPELPGPGQPVLVGAGHGLVGMRERVALYGGEFVADHRTDGGFHIGARLPYSDMAT